LEDTGVVPNATTRVITLSGTPRSGERWTVTLSAGVSAFHDVTGVQDLATVATQLASNLNALAEYAVASQGDRIVVTKVTSGGFTPALTVTPSGTSQVDSAATLVGALRVIFSGASVTGESWSVSVDGGTSLAETVLLSGGSAEPLSDVVARLAARVDSLAGYAAASEGSEMMVWRIGSTALAVAGTPPGAGKTITTSATGFTSHHVTLAGTPYAGETWSIQADHGAAEELVIVGEDRGQVAEFLASAMQVKADLVASNEGSVVLVAKITNASFVVTSLVEAQGSGTEAALAGNASEALSLRLTGYANAGDIWSLRIAGGGSLADLTVTYSLSPADLANSTSNLVDMAAGLASLLNAATGDYALFTAAAESDRIEVVRLENTAFNVVLTVTPSSGQATAEVAGTVASSWVSDLVLDPRAPGDVFEADDVWGVTILGYGTTTYRVGETSDGRLLAGVLAGIAGKLSASVNPAVITVSGQARLRLHAADFSLLSVGPITQTRVKAYELSVTPGASIPVPTPITYADGVTSTNSHWLSVDLQLKGEFAAGEDWTVSVDGRDFTYSVPKGEVAGNRTLGRIAEELALKINAAPGLPYAATATAAGKLTVYDENAAPGEQDPFSVSLRRGGNKVVGVFDIDRSALIQSYAQVQIGSIAGFPIYQYFPYLAFTSLELVDGAGQVLAKDWYGVQPGPGTTPRTPTQDVGSSTDRDAFLTYQFSNPGTYTVRVGSVRQYLGLTPPGEPTISQGTQGVPAGMSYDLNVSLQRHATSTNAIALKDKLLTVVEGAGAGQSSRIKSYNAETRTYELYDLWTTPVNATSRFEISYDIDDEFPAYSPVLDPYTVVLSGRPSAPVVVDVMPRPTVTYNSELAFDPDANFGRNEAVQVRVATSQAVLRFSGTPSGGATYRVILTGDDLETPLAFERASGAGAASLASIVEDLRALVDGHADFSAALVGSSQLLVKSVSRGSALVNGSAAAQTGISASVALGGAVRDGEVWILNAGGTTVTHTAQGTETLYDIATALAAALPADLFNVARSGNTLMVSRDDGTAFETTVAVNAVHYFVDVEVVGGSVTAEVVPQLVFTPATWNVPQWVTVAALDDQVLDGQDALVFAPFEQRINGIRGPLFIDGAARVGEERFLSDPFRLPGETNYPMPDGFIESFLTTGGSGALLRDPWATHTSRTLGEERPGFDPRTNEFL
ncbi:MAG: hypothetical protein IT580_20790, partial [Verrucomicrobiales bacterium]|nr:hypothetical protein [Verrucomicrobiales bacterium]